MQYINPEMDIIYIPQISGKPSVYGVVVKHGEPEDVKVMIGYIHSPKIVSRVGESMPKGAVNFVLESNGNGYRRIDNKVDAAQLYKSVGMDATRVFLANDSKSKAIDFDGSADAAKAKEIHRKVSALAEEHGIVSIDIAISEKGDYQLFGFELSNQRSPSDESIQIANIAGRQLKKFKNCWITFKLLGVAHYTVGDKTYEHLAMKR